MLLKNSCVTVDIILSYKGYIVVKLEPPLLPSHECISGSERNLILES